MKFFTFFLFLISALFFTACSNSDSSSPQKTIGPAPKGVEQQYQIGATWDRFVVDPTFLSNNNNPAFLTLARATGKFESMDGTGTVFYIGKHNGKHLVATNKHVAHEKFIVAGGDTCSAQNKSPFIGRIFFNPLFLEPETHIQCVGYIGMWDNIDFAILEIKEFSDTKYLESLTPMKFLTEPTLKKGTEFISVGYGLHQNQGHQFQKGIIGKNCRLFSDESILLTDDEDKITTAWSFATNCDVSHGDSGSPLADMNQVGLVHGVIWSSGAINKPNLLNENYVENLFQNSQDPRLWDELSFAIPSSKILETLEAWTLTSPANSDEVTTIKAFLESAY
ncbi:MAG: trypsin-like peptidase domain-containing protein [Bdellovibrionaceae bacterium]|nr:trypsin-like peptidase domain-containing protein [Pseudobdellovibrionaceae bacterium]